MERRIFLQKSLAASALALSGSMYSCETNNTKMGFYRLARSRDRFILVDPAGKPFYSLSLNHLDPASLMYPENREIWLKKYGNSMERWLKQVREDIQEWNFNSIGWTQEVVIRNKEMHQHSRPFTYEEYQWLNMPYFHMLPFAQFHHWDTEHRHPDFFSDAFAEWCDYVARRHCTRFAADPNLVGYFTIDCPAWIHHKEKNAWKGPLFDPQRLASPDGRDELKALADQYYRVVHDAIRRYDSNHLIFGDRFEANNPLADEVILAAARYVDVISFQHFDTAEEIAANIRKYHQLTGKPILIADFGVPDYSTWEQGYFALKSDQYKRVLSTLRDEVPECVGLHFCGAYMENKVRKHGLYDRQEEKNEAFAAISEENERTLNWASQLRLN